MADAFIKILGGPRQGLNVPLSLTEPLIVGRKRGDLILNDPLASGKHAKIYPRDNGWFIQDLNSTNGTLVDGRLIREAALRPGVEITIGNTRMALFIGLEVAQENISNTNVQTTAARLEIAAFTGIKNLKLLQAHLIKCLGGSANQQRYAQKQSNQCFHRAALSIHPSFLRHLATLPVESNFWNSIR